ncbi:MAG: response regulator transcription factor [Ilumatobacteraceae bacterium]
MCAGCSTARSSSTPASPAGSPCRPPGSIGEFWPGAALGLSQRESEVLELIVRGKSNKNIAEDLMLGDETIKTHVRSLYRKLGVTDRAQAVAYALREGTFR